MVRLLIVDDSEVFRRSIRQLLHARFAGIECHEASTAAQALAQAGALEPHLAFIDVRLPDGSGLDLSRRLRAEAPATRLCVVTSFDLPEYREAARACGVRHYIVKGNATAADFVAVMRSLLDERPGEGS